MNVNKITIGRLYNLGSYEHVRYEVSVEIGPEESARDAMIGLERIMESLAPESQSGTESPEELKRSQARIDEMHEQLLRIPDDEFRCKHGYFDGTSSEYVARCQKSLDHEKAKREEWEQRSAKARLMLDKLGGAAHWKDCKLDWETEDDQL